MLTAAHYNERMIDDPWAGLEAKTASRAWADFKGKGKASASNDGPHDAPADSSEQLDQGVGSDVEEKEEQEEQNGQIVADATGPADTEMADGGGPPLEGWSRRKAHLAGKEFHLAPAPNEERLDGDDDDDIL